MRLGDVVIEGVRDGSSELPLEFFGADKLDAEERARHADMVGPDGQVRLPIAGFVVHTGGKKVLMDAGLGPVSVEWQPETGGSVKLYGGGLPGSLQAIGLKPEDIDIVLLSHLHSDHSGWVWQNGRPYFPNATVRFGRGDWETYVEQGVPGADGPGFKALAELGKVDLIDSDGEVAPGITSLHTPGHTPGHQIFIVSSGDQRALFLGDAVSCPLQLEKPEVEAVADMDKGLGARTRERILTELETSDYVGGPHFPDVKFGRMLVGQGQTLWN